MDDDDASAAVAVRMGVLFGGTAMCGPTGVPNTECAIERFNADDFFQVPQLALGTPNLQAIAIPCDGDSGRVVAAIFKTSQTLDDDRYYLFASHVSDNATHS